MRATFYPDEDILRIKLSDQAFAYGKDLGDARHLNFSADHRVISVEFLYVSDGVDLTGIPDYVVAAISPVLEKRSVRIFA